MKKAILLLSAIFIHCAFVLTLQAGEICLNGLWDYGFERHYSGIGNVPGLHTDPTAPGDGTLWYRRSVTLPSGSWTNATLELKGARFLPKVYVNGLPVSEAGGGMARTFHDISVPGVRPGAEVVLEIALSSLGDVPSDDASWIPTVDQWRSSCASCLWDDVVLHTWSGARLDRILTRYENGSGEAAIKYRIRGNGATMARFRIMKDGLELCSFSGSAGEGDNSVSFNCSGLVPWSPENPECYEINATLENDEGTELSSYSQTFALKDFRINDKQFNLNGHPFKIRGGTVVWHRWMRDPAGRELGWNTEWFEKNIVRRLKDHGANYLRFHLGVPPERLLDLCDRTGLAVQYEWNFFHGAPASVESMVSQYSAWLDMASRHPCVLLFHPFNETEGEQLDNVWTALNTVLKDYPPLILEERDVTHVHKYWWSLFENVGLYYDSTEQFDKAIMVDEFGGNYLDGNGDMGLYPSIRESYMRFLGPNHTRESRLHHLDRSCAKIAEYWRRIGAAGISPFTIASSQEDGCNWFMGPLADGKPKNVWDALTVLWSPRSVSMDIWDSNFTPGQTIIIPLHFFNDTPLPAELECRTSILDADGNEVNSVHRSCNVSAYGHEIRKIRLSLPPATGDYMLRTELLNPTSEVHSRVLSDWDIRILKAQTPAALTGRKVFIPRQDRELRRFAARNGLKRTSSIAKADIILTGAGSWPLDRNLVPAIEAAVERGCSVVMLDAGEKYLGQGYPTEKGELGPLQGVKKVKDPVITEYPLFCGLKMTCMEMAEPESHFHPYKNDDALWNNLPKDAESLWNGLRGGLNVPSADMELDGLSADAFINQWTSRGADAEKIRNRERYYAYNLCGIYAFDSERKNEKVIKALRDKVAFLIEDAPALSLSLNANAPVRLTDLSEAYSASLAGKAKSFSPLACCGKNLTRTPVVCIGFGEGKGKVIISQLITDGRLNRNKRCSSVEGYGTRYDEAAVQTVLNMLATASGD